MTPHPHHIYWKSATPDDFKNAELLDWIEGVGEIATHYQLNFIRKFGSASHTLAKSEQPRFNSTDLLLLANDEWKRREERKHNHDPQAWQAGFINGFLTDWKWARNWIDKIQREAELHKRGEQHCNDPEVVSSKESKS